LSHSTQPAEASQSLSSVRVQVYGLAEALHYIGTMPERAREISDGVKPDSQGESDASPSREQPYTQCQ
jgi:hypothetical protein